MSRLSLPLLPIESPALAPERTLRAQPLWLAVNLRDSPPLPAARDETLAALAGWSRELTALVSLERPDGLLLEVRGSLKLFGGIGEIKRRIATELKGRRLKFDLCAAPTPLAALWLARRAQADVLEASTLPGRIAALPLEATRWPDDVLDLLAGMGVRAVGECLRLPRDGFSRRVGAQYLRELDKALGKLPDLRREFETPPVFGRALELAGEITQTELLASALRRLVADLADDLRGRQRQVQSVCLVLRHAHRPATAMRLELIEPTYDARRICDSLLVRLERTPLPAPVIALGVHGDAAAQMRIEETKLFSAAAAGRAPVSRAALLERLRARFGGDSVYSLALSSDHRPERAWGKLTESQLRSSCDAAERPPSRTADRPLWLLPAPLPLAGLPAALREEVSAAALAAEPERIESGWWDGADVGRDYYAVTAGGGQKLWVYRDRIARAWYLHGFFG